MRLANGVRVIVDGDGALEGEVPSVGTLDVLLRLKGGMESGRSSVGIGIRMPDGSLALAETSLRILKAAVDTFVSADEGAGLPPALDKLPARTRIYTVSEPEMRRLADSPDMQGAGDVLDWIRAEASWFETT